MAKKVKKPKKSMHPMPKLGWKDQLLYWTIFALTLGGVPISIFFPIWFRDRIVAMDADVIAWNPGEGYGKSIWLCIWLLVVWLIVVTVFYQHRRPIFGRTDIKYGPPAYPRVYPLLMKNKPKYWQSPKAVARKKKLITVTSCILLITFLFIAAVYPGSLYGRYELRRDGTVAVFDSRNQLTARYHLAEVESVQLDTKRSSGGRYSSGSWYALMTLCFSDGEKYGFSIRSLGDDWIQAIQTAERLKEIYGSRVRIEGVENLWKVVLDTDMSYDEELMLYQLFEAK